MANDRTVLDAQIVATTAIEQSLITNVQAAFARLKTPIDYTPEINSVNAIIAALTTLDTLAKSQ